MSPAIANKATIIPATVHTILTREAGNGWRKPYLEATEATGTADCRLQCCLFYHFHWTMFIWPYVELGSLAAHSTVS